ncbi:MAG TPA: response regulator transcription factor [Bryobacteraceae bacterium]|jgi:DNA-binding response OmpR family regulator|nr:response regulator transcription factor [Bryobacteraceae bacterium]
MSRILIVEDEPGIAFALENDLQTEGYEVAVVADGVEAVSRARSEPFDLILLDVMLPNKDGFDVCRELRRGGLRTPIIMLTAKTQEAEKILGLDLGADDYVTKPFSPRELRARIRAVFRRGVAEAGDDVHRFGRCELDLVRFELRRDGQRVEATHTELKLLTAFVRRQGRVLTREHLLEEVWGSGVYVSDRVVDNHIVALRKKIEDDPVAPRHLISIRGVGYRFDV